MKRLMTFVCVVVALSLVAALSAASGGLDPSFGARGKVVTDFGEGDLASAMTLQPDGKIVVVGETGTHAYRFAIARFQSNGRLDSSFDRDGKVVIACPNDCGAYSVAIQRDGGMIVGGIELGKRQFALIRLKPDGSRDLAFGIGGWAESGFNGGVFGIALQPDGKILVAGSDATPDRPAIYLAVARFTPEGRLDASFARAGRALINLGNLDVSTAFLQQDGKLVVVFYGPRDRVTLSRIDANGRLDRTFGRQGSVRTHVGGESPELAIQPDGKLVVAGSRGNSLLVARYHRTGRPDRSFGRGGLARRAFRGERLYLGGLGIDSRGRIVVAGSRVKTVRGVFYTFRRFVLIRLFPNGRIDRAFGVGGSPRPGYDEPTAIGIQRNGRILVAGTHYSSSQLVPGHRTAFFVARYLGRR